MDQVDRCFATEEDVEIYYLGVGDNLGMQLLNALENADYSSVSGLLGVANLKVLDSNGNEVGAENSVNGLDGNVDGNGGSSNGEAGFDDAVITRLLALAKKVGPPQFEQGETEEHSEDDKVRSRQGKLL